MFHLLMYTYKVNCLFHEPNIHSYFLSISTGTLNMVGVIVLSSHMDDLEADPSYCAVLDSFGVVLLLIGGVTFILDAEGYRLRQRPGHISKGIITPI